MTPKTLRKYSYLVLIVAIAFALPELAARNHWIDAAENIFYDTWHQLAGKRYTPEHAVIAAIDDETLEAHKNEPTVFWGPHYARAIRTLREAGAAVVGIDILYAVSVESWLHQIQKDFAFDRIETALDELSRTFDISFREQLNAGDVVLIGTVVRDQEGEAGLRLPVNDYIFSLPRFHEDIGLANLYTDPDEVVRSFVPRIFETPPAVTFGPLLVQRAAAKAPALRPPGREGDTLDKLLLETDPRPIGYVGPPGTFPRISFQRLLGSNALEDPAVQALKGKIVIIALEHAGTSDIHLTPYTGKRTTRSARVMTGPEIHANIIETLLTDKFPKPMSAPLRMTWLAVLCALGCALFYKRPPIQGLGILFLLAGAGLMLAYALFLKDLVLPVAAGLLTLLIGYVGVLGLRLTRGEKDRLNLRRAIGSYVSDTVVDSILESGALPDLGGETLDVTVLFSDIRGFTTLSEMLEPKEVVDMLNEYYTRVCEPILAEGGMIDKFIGDAVMAIFGAPARHPDHARRAVRAALEMQQIAKEFQGWLKQRFPGKNIPPFRVGVGLHSGSAVIGNVGSSKRMGYTAIGDTVNIAARLESLSKKLGWAIVASAETVKQAGEGVKTEGKEKVQPTGRAGFIEVTGVLGVD